MNTVVSKRTRPALISWAGQSISIAIAAIILLLIVGGIVDRGFVTVSNLLSILGISALLGLAAAGQTLVVISGSEGIDLSIGAVISLAAVLTSQISAGTNSGLLTGLIAALIAGGIIGLLNGVGILYAKLPPLIMTLAMASVVEGVILVYTQGQPKGQSPALLSTLSTGRILGIPWLVVVWALITAGIILTMRKLVYGRMLFLIGSNRDTARFSGLPVSRLVLLTYTLSGVLSALAGVFFLGYTGTTYLNIGDPYVLPSVAAVVIGGTALSGGRGGYAGTVAGAILLTVLNSVLVTLHTSDAGRQIVNGIVLLVLLSLYTRNRDSR